MANPTTEASGAATPKVTGLIRWGSKIIFQERAKEPAKGKWALPHRSIAAGETPAEALARGAMQEMGLLIEVIGKFGEYDMESNGENFHITCLMAEAKTEKLELNPIDASRAEWLTMQEALQRDLPVLSEKIVKDFLGIKD